MKTITISKKDMEGRIARFRSLKPLAIQNESIPVEARDVIYSRKLLSVIGLEANANTPINAGAPIVGAAGMTMTLAVCPPGQGPGLHSHRKTYETFIGSGEGILQVIITGGVHDMSDIDFAPEAKRQIEAVRPGLAAEFEKAGFTFTAGSR